MLELPQMTDYGKTRAEFGFDIPTWYNFGFDVISRRAKEADKTALIFVDRFGARIETHSFGRLDRASNRFAHVLLEQGVAKGEFALVVLPRIPAWHEVLLGCIKTGVVAMPGTTLLTAKDIAYRLSKSGARLAIVGADHAHKIDEIRDQCPTLERLIIVGGERDGWISYEQACADTADRLSRSDVAPTRASDLMLVYFTSGTTGPPKMVPHEHSYALAHTITGRYWMDLRQDDIHWTLSDTGWAKAAWGTFPPWQMGAAIVAYDAASPFDADAHLRLIAQLGVTTFCAPPTAYRIFAQLNLRQYDLNSIRHSIGAGEPLNPEVMRLWKDATGTDIYDGYGQTETINLVANYPCLPLRPGSMGKPVPGLDVQLVDEHGNVVRTGQIGEIAVRMTDPHPPGLFHGYHQEPMATDSCFRDGWYYTGDTAQQDENGYIWFVGRADDIITSAGYRISPFEVESALLEHPTVAEAAAIGKPDPLRGEVVKAYITLAKGYEPSQELKKELQAFVKTVTAPYKYPREIEFRSELPKTISGKIRRVDLRAEAKAEASGQRF
jgi:acetyl-CoA synthetase